MRTDRTRARLRAQLEPDELDTAQAQSAIRAPAVDRLETTSEPAFPSLSGAVLADAGNAATARLLGSAGGLRVNRHGSGHGDSSADGGGSGALDGDVAAAIQSARGGAAGLPAVLRAQMESGLGADLSAVRIHTDATADRLSRSVQAHAFTTGADIFFSQGSYDPAGRPGQELIAHELTHVVQQSTGAFAGAEGTVSHPGDPHEVEARTVAAALVNGPGRDGGSFSGAAGGVERAVGVEPSVGGAQPGTIVARAATGLPVVHRHSSWEHAMMGDVGPAELAGAVDNAKQPGGARIHLVLAEHDRMVFFRDDPKRDPRQDFPAIHWIQLKTSRLWISYGELNALADYLPNPGTIDQLTQEEIIPVLQRMRQVIDESCWQVVDLHGALFTGAATAFWTSLVSSAGGEVVALTEATASLKQNSYSGLLSRNACHFAPDSWQRWAEYHAQACAAAAEFYGLSHSGGAGLAERTAGLEHDAWMNNGYGDHFLQDSFAAGHLVNKTLVMQWFAEYLAELKPEPVMGPDGDLYPGLQGPAGYAGMDQDMLEAMEDPKHTGTGQPGIAGRALYAGPDFTATDQQDRASGSHVSDPQSAQERATPQGRLAGSGVQAEGGQSAQARYAQYGDFLNSSFLQKASGAVHDWFNQRGLSVRNAQGVQMRVGGDDTLLTQSNPQGAALAGQASAMSRQAIAEILASGSTSRTPQAIFELVPTQVVLDDGSAVGLEAWNDDVVRELCLSKIFPQVLADPVSSMLQEFSPQMVKGGVVH